jgi:hypothetical protein
VQPITLDVTREFGTPVFGPRSRDAPLSAVGMLMPETTVDENHPLPTSEREIRFTRECLVVKPISISKFRHDSADHQFRLSVFVMNLPHVG